MSVLPQVPRVFALNPVPTVSASEAALLRNCPLRVVLNHDPSLRRLRRYAASAVIGTAAHAALSSLSRARSRGAQDCNLGTREIARRAFDEALALECARRDATIAERGELPGECTEPPTEIPYCSMTRARVARFAEQRFGSRWEWRLPVFDGHHPRVVDASSQRSRQLGPELPLESADGVVRGIADSVDRIGTDVIVDEFKTGEATPDRLAAWKHQLLIYASLYLDQHGILPTRLRVHSLPSGTHEFTCTESEAAQAVAVAAAALRDVNGRIASGVSAEGLARPSKSECMHCAHRPWCEAYWVAGVSVSCDGDVEGSVIGSAGWEVEIRVPSGTVRVDCKALGIAPTIGMRIRICGARARSDGTLLCDRTSSAWKIAP